MKEYIEKIQQLTQTVYTQAVMHRELCEQVKDLQIQLKAANIRISVIETARAEAYERTY